MSSASGEARHQHALVDPEGQAGKETDAREIGGGQAFLDPPRQQPLHGLLRGGADAAAVAGAPALRGQLKCVQHEGRRFIAGVVRAVPEEHAGAPQAPRAALDEFPRRLAPGRPRRCAHGAAAPMK
jgi:hypothetical protein